jgi:hypothetical protein
MNQYRLDYLSEQLDKVRRASESARSAWSQQWMTDLQNRLSREIQYASIDPVRRLGDRVSDH